MFDVENAELQISELETLESIYPNENEVMVRDLQDLVALKQFVETEGSSIAPTKKLHITLNMTLDDETNKAVKVECSLPPSYPKESLPDIFLRCDAMGRQMQQQFNSDLIPFMGSIELGECCLYQIVQWAVENAPKYISSSNTEALETISTSNDEPCTFTRMWIYSHHIYSKEKRKCILEWAKELNLTGFSMPGKPGVICVEGIRENCEDYWQRLRRQTWKRLSVVHKEESSVRFATLDGERKFSTVVSEMDFGVHGGRDYHMDLGKFFEYLKEHQCEHMFPILFGVEGKTSEKS